MTPTDPLQLADLVLALATSGIGEMVFIEPSSDSTIYSIACERGGETTSITIPAKLAHVTIARLAMIARVDLSAGHATGAVVATGVGSDVGEVVVTIRPGAGLRADVASLPKRRASRPSTSNAEVVLREGSTVGAYKIVERLGEGGMGTVYRAEHALLGNMRALKVLRGQLFEGFGSASQRFLREARAAARIHNPHIVDVYDFGYLADGRPFIVMELLHGESLLDVVDRGSLPAKDAVTIARQLATALAAAHDAGVVHADVTPANAYVVSTQPLVAKLLDFGLAELVGEVAQDEKTGFVLGTPSYISPEQLRGMPATDRSDQYSLGAVLFEMLVGRPPYIDDDLRKLCMKHIEAPIPDVISKYGPLPPMLGDVVSTCLAKSPQARFPGMRALIAALDEVERVTDRPDWRRYLAT